MNVKKFRMMMGRIVVFRPQPMGATGPLNESHNSWTIVNEVENRVFLFKNTITNHELRLGVDNIDKYQTPNILILRGQATLKDGGGMDFEPSVPGISSVGSTVLNDQHKVLSYKLAVALLAAVVFGIFALVFINYRGNWFTPTPEIHLGAAFYAYERGVLQEGKITQTIFGMRNLVSNCSLWRSVEMPPKQSGVITDMHSWALSKFLLENVSTTAITNLRIGMVSPLFQPTTRVVATPNVEAVGKLESTSNDASHTYVISVPSIPGRTSAVVSLETPIDEKLRKFLYVDHGRADVRLPFLSADQLGTFIPQFSRINAMELVKRESQIRTGERTFANEKITTTVLGLDELNLKATEVSTLLLPVPLTCPPGKGGDW
jgi:hypothetical protein